MTRTIRLFLGLSLLVTWLGFSFSPVHAAESQDLYYLGASFRNGLVLYFSVPDGFNWEDANKSVTVDGISYELDCRINAQGILACFAGVKEKSIGQPAHISFGDFSFDTVVPLPKQSLTAFNQSAGFAAVDCTYGYDIYDWGPGDIPWGLVGLHCQSDPAVQFDEIVYTNPNYGSSSRTYKYLLSYLLPNLIPAELEDTPGYWSMTVPGPIIIDDEICIDFDCPQNQ